MPDIVGSFGDLLGGFGSALTWQNLLFALLGCILGTMVGVLPGIGPSTTVALLIPVAFAMAPDSTLIMMAGVYLGAMYGGSLTSVLLKVPGEASSAMTAIDGFEMAKQGRAGPALAIAAIGSFVGGTLSVVALTLFAPVIAHYALAFGPVEYFSLMAAALLFSSVLLGGNLLKGLSSIVLGLLVAVIGTDLQTGVPRLTFGSNAMLDGVDIVVLLMGLFGVAEVFWFLAHKEPDSERLALRGRLWPSRSDWRRSWPAIGRSSVVGFLVGVLPGSGSTLGAALGYSIEKRVSKRSDEFGKGAVEGVAAPETANNAATGGALVPMLTLGVPGSGTTAILLAVFTIYGIQPGPRLMEQHGDVVWVIIASLYISNVILLLLNLPLIRVFVRILDIPVRFLMPLVLAVAAIGAYSVNNNIADVVILFVFGLVGYLLRVVGIPIVPFVLAAVLAPMMEQSLRQAMLISGGSWAPFVTHPISAVFLAAGLLAVGWDIVRSRTKGRRTTPIAEDE